MPAGETGGRPMEPGCSCANGEIDVMSGATGVTMANLTNHPAYDFSPDVVPRRHQDRICEQS